MKALGKASQRVGLAMDELTGRNIVAAFLRSVGFEVIDLGCEVPVEVIAAAAREFSVDIIGTSALLATTAPEQKKLEKYLRQTGERSIYYHGRRGAGDAALG